MSEDGKAETLGRTSEESCLFEVPGEFLWKAGVSCDGVIISAMSKDQGTAGAVEAGGGDPNQDELSENLWQTLFNTATYHELLDCNHSRAHKFKKGWA